MSKRAPFESVRLDGLTKHYGSTTALVNVSCTFLSGEVHAVLGENGAGKSTLAAILCGHIRPDSGSGSLVGNSPEPLPLGSPRASRALGIEMVHQHFTLVPEFTVEENLALGRVGKAATLLDLAALSSSGFQAGEALGWHFNPRSLVRDLSVGEQQRLEIMRVLADQPQVVVFDEPTAVLSREETSELFRILRSLKEQGRIVVLIAHKLSEVMQIADRVTILRRGEKVAEAERGEFDEEKLAHWMVGELPPLSQSLPPSLSTPRLQVQNLRVKGDRGNLAVDNISFEVNSGEIFGIGGVDGNGQIELAECLADVRKAVSGSLIRIGDDRERDIAYIPQDRQKDGLALEMSVYENMLISGVRREEFTRWAFLRTQKLRKWSEQLISRFDIKSRSSSVLVSALSGGNQQKVVVSRVLDRSPSLLIACNPTRGLDLKATRFVRSKILEARDQGTAVVLISSDLDELSELDTRTCFLSAGRLLESDSAASLLGGAAPVGA